MKTLKILFLFTTLFSLILATGCKKEDDTQPQGNAREFQLKTVTAPDAMTQSSDPGAQQAAGYMYMVNGLATYGTMMTPPKSADAVHLKSSNEGNPEIYTWNVDDGNDNNYSVTLTITETPESYRWDMKVDGLLDGHQVHDLIFLKAEQYKDGHDNLFIVYDLEKPLTPSLKFNWHKTNDVFYLTFEEPQDIYVSFVINPDNSGSIDAKEWTEEEEYQMTYTATWDPSGHGEYWEYDNGEVIEHGNW